MIAWLWWACAAPPEPAVGPRWSFGPVETWSHPAGDLPQHHATVAVTPDAVWVAWTEGAVEASPTSWVASRAGRTADAVALRGGATAAKPDVVEDGAGAPVVVYQTPQEGIWVERVGEGSLPVPIASPAAASGNNSPDAAVAADGAVVSVWFDEEPWGGLFRSASVSADLMPVADRVEPAFGAGEAGADLTPDVAASPDGGCVVAWLEQHAAVTEPDALWLSRYGPDGTLLGEWEVDRAPGETPPRRPTVVVDGQGRIGVVWRRQPKDDTTASESWFATFDAEGQPIAAAARADVGVDDPVAVLVAERWWLIADAAYDEGWQVRLSLRDFPSGALLAGPHAVSATGDADRPAIAAAAVPGGAWAAVSWEERTPGSERVVLGRTIHLW
jgi:hypothetical protein